MDLSEDERGWALAIKEALTKENPVLAATISDFEFAQHAIIAKHKVPKALKRIHGLHQFREDHGIPSPATHDAKAAMQVIEEFQAKCDGSMFLSLGKEHGNGRSVSAWAYNALAPSSLATPEDWKNCLAAFYYMLDAMQPDMAAVRAGIVLLFECQDAGWRNFSYHMEKHAAHLCQNAYPVRTSSLLVLHAPTLFTVLYALIKPLLTKKVRNAVDLGGNKAQVHKHYPKEIIPTAMGGTHTPSDMEKAILAGLEKRYQNMANFKL